MSPAGIDSHLQQSELAEVRVDSALYTIVSDRFTSARASGGHANAAHTVATDALVNRAALVWHALRHSLPLRSGRWSLYPGGARCRAAGLLRLPTIDQSDAAEHTRACPG